MAANEFDAKCNIIDTTTPRYNPLSGRYKKSLAFYILTERYPIILTEIIVQLSRDKNEIADLYGGDETLKEIKFLVDCILELKQHLQTDKRFEIFDDEEADQAVWNNFIQNLPTDLCSFFHSHLLYAECYLYRKLSSFFKRTKTLKNYDFFAKQKKDVFNNEAIFSVLNGVTATERDFKTFSKLMKLNLWANKFDLNIVAPQQFQLDEYLFEQLESFNDKILINDSKLIWQCLSSADHSKPVIVEFINDNAGFELLSDLVLAEYLIDKQLASQVRFSVKAIPWFVSDALASDISWTLEHLSKHESPVVKRFAAKCRQYFKEYKFIMSPVHYFWVSPYEYYKMRELASDLYQYLSEAHLIIFKGDLNYRKLLGDMNWDPTDDFITGIRGFRPTNFCALRSIKTELVCGLSQGKAEQLHHFDSRWMCSTDYGVIQFMEERFCNCHKINL